MTDAAAERSGRSVSAPQPDACSVLWDHADHARATALGTAPLARFWVALEQNGPWGAQAATQSHLDPDLGGSIDRMCQEGSGRFILIRRPGRHPDRHEGDHQPASAQRVYIAGGLGDRPWLLEADLADPGRLERLGHLAGLAPLGLGGSVGRLGLSAVRDALPELQTSPAPVLMICTNSRRDVCCSVRGRPVAAESASQRPGRVWECSHTGGHRFAPTGVLLPYGQTFGRLSGSSAVEALDAATRAEVPAELLGTTHDRGRSHLIAPAQVAESVVREETQEHHMLALSTTAEPRGDDENTWGCRVRHTDGRHWDLVVVRRPSGVALPESCGKEAVPGWEWSVVGEAGQSVPGG